jgi:hypothetical protein
MGIVIAALITTLIVVVVYGYVLRRITTPQDQDVAFRAALIMLPMQPLAFYAVRMPLHHFLEAKLGPGPALTAISLFYAPLTEEPAKWLVLLLPFIRKQLTPRNAVAVAIGTGLGFGIGEIWFLVLQLMRSSAIRELPFYAFGGFLSERFVVTFLHGALVAFLFKWLAEGRSFWPGALLGVALHFALNFPIYLAGIDLGHIGAAAWQALLQVYVFGFAIVLAVAVNRLARDRLRAGVLGSATCPECGAVYPRTFIAINMLTRRYERCPNCRHWHWVRMNQGEPPSKA